MATQIFKKKSCVLCRFVCVLATYVCQMYSFLQIFHDQLPVVHLRERMINKCLKIKNYVVIVVLLPWLLLLDKTCFYENMN